MVRWINFIIRFAVVKKCIERLNRNLPTDKKPVVVYGSMNGNFYGDNAVHIFEYNSREDTKYVHIWMTKSIRTYVRLKLRDLNVSLMFTASGLRYLNCALFGFYTDSLRDLALFPSLVPRDIQLIALRHGRSVKRVRFARLNHKISSVEALERSFEGDLVKYAISTSEFISDLQEQCLRIGRQKHVVTGYPRNDVLIRESKSSCVSGSFRILYAPTWRHGRTHTKFFPFKDFDEITLERFLRDNSVEIHFRPHATEVRSKEYVKIKRLFKKRFKERVTFVDQKSVPDINSVLFEYDLLICDYSALYHDFLLLNRPIILIPYDYYEFSEANGFLYDYFENAPGPIVTSFREFIFKLTECLEGRDKFKNKRLLLKEKIHQYTDTKSCERVRRLLYD